MMNLLHIRNGKKAYAIYALALFVFCSVGLVMKNFNDKIAMMSDSVISYQQMIDKQSEQMKSITRERERFKRELAEEKEEKEMTVNELKNSIHSVEQREMQEKRKKEKEISELRDRLQTVELEKNKVEGKYKTLSKANGDAVADIEYFKSENKKLRSQLHEASTSKTSEQLQLRDSLAKVAAERDKYKEQYSALFRQLQQSMDSVQLLQTEKDRLQEQIREIQRLSGGGRSSSAVPEVHQQVEPERLAGRGAVGGQSPQTSSARALPQVMEEPAQGGEAIVSSSTSSSVIVQAAEPALAQAPPPLHGLPQVKQLPQPQKMQRQQQQQQQQGFREVQPIQPQLVRRRYEGMEEDALQAPRANQIYQQQPGWYPGHGQIGAAPGYGRQVVPQVGKYGGQPVAHVGRYGVQPKYDPALAVHHQQYVAQPQVWNHQQQFGLQQEGEEEEEEEEEEDDEGGAGAIPFYANHRAL